MAKKKKKIKKQVKVKKKKVVRKAKPKTFDEVRNIVRHAKAFHIVRGKSYLYFCVQPSQEQVVFQQILKRKSINVASVYNYKDNIIGYLVEFTGKKPHLDIAKGAEGAAIFFSTKTNHTKPELIFADQKLRVLSFDDEDYFVSVKWKSIQQVEEGA